MTSWQQRGLRLVLISDTHGEHRSLDMPAGDVLIHGGDFTSFGKRKDADNFNEWLGTLPYSARLVVLGNHEANAEWVEDAATILSNATLLRGSAIRIPASVPPTADSGASPAPALCVYGTDFFWPAEGFFKPPYDEIPFDCDVLISHGPALGHCDGGTGCGEILKHIIRVKPRVFVCGHIHEARGVCEGEGALAGTTFFNAANAPPRDTISRKSNKKPTGDAARPAAARARAPMVVDL